MYCFLIIVNSIKLIESLFMYKFPLWFPVQETFAVVFYFYITRFKHNYKRKMKRTTDQNHQTWN